MDNDAAGATVAAGAAEWTVESLDEALEQGRELFILDVRNSNEFARARIEGRHAIPTRNVPYFGAGSRMLRAMMSQQHVESLEDLVKLARELGVMGIRDQEPIQGVEHGGAGTFLGSALRSKAALFI